MMEIRHLRRQVKQLTKDLVELKSLVTDGFQQLIDKKKKKLKRKLKKKNKGEEEKLIGTSEVNSKHKAVPTFMTNTVECTFYIVGIILSKFLNRNQKMVIGWMVVIKMEASPEKY